MQPLLPFHALPPDDDPPIQTGTEVPKELDIFCRTEYDFIPPGKTFDDLTDEEKQALKDKYRFDPLKPGIYQGITGKSGMI